MIVLVLGGTGFLGRHVCRALSDAGALVEVGPPREQVDLRMASPDDIAVVLRRSGAQAVVNATGQVTGALPDLLWGNAEVVRRLVDACGRVRSGIRLVHLGSAAEYGPTPSGEWIAESRPAEPVTPYGIAKLAATDALLAATRVGDVDGIVLRVFNPVGSGQPANSLLGKVAAQLVSHPVADLTVGSLHAFRDFVSAKDVGRAAARAALAELPPPASSQESRLFNVGSGRVRAVRDVVELLRVRAGHRGSLIEDPAGGSERSRTVDGAPADIRRAVSGLGWQPVDGLEAAVDQVIAGAGAELAALPGVRAQG